MAQFHLIAGMLRWPGRNARVYACKQHGHQPHVQFGFTLIELLVVFTLLALLLTLATPRYLKTLEGGKSKVQAQNMATLRDAIDKFRADQGRYPVQLEEIVAKQYLRQVPVDPVSGTRDWVSVPSPNPEEAGIYDIKAPELPSAALLPDAGADALSGPAGTGQSPTTPNTGSAPAAPSENPP
jgi:general secretion pathway protein G